MRRSAPLFFVLPFLSGCVVAQVAETAAAVVSVPVKVVSAGVDAATTSQSEADERRGRELREADERRARDAAKKAAGEPRSKSRAHVRYFLDTEFDGFGGALLSLALVPEDGEEFYVTLECHDPLEPWVERNVVPFLDHVPVGLVSPRVSRAEAAMALSAYLAADAQPEVIADWPEDFSQFCGLLMTGPGQMVPVPALTLRFLPLPGFSTAANSAVPHNALHDARSLRDHILSLE